MTRAWEAQDLPQLAELAHWIKGAGGTAGFDQFTELAGRLERCIQESCTTEISRVISEMDGLAMRIDLGVAAAP